MTEHDIMAAVTKQVTGLVAEKAALQQQIDGLVAERDAYRTTMIEARRILGTGRTVGRDWQQKALDAENLLAHVIGQ